MKWGDSEKSLNIFCWEILFFLKTETIEEKFLWKKMFPSNLTLAKNQFEYCQKKFFFELHEFES